MVGDLSEAKVAFESMYGTMKSHWKKTATSTEMNLEIPVNTRALVYFPSKDLGKVFENGKRVDYPLERVEEERLVIKLGSGRYNFTIEH